MLYGSYGRLRRNQRPPRCWRQMQPRLKQSPGHRNTGMTLFSTERNELETCTPVNLRIDTDFSISPVNPTTITAETQSLRFRLCTSLASIQDIDHSLSKQVSKQSHTWRLSRWSSSTAPLHVCLCVWSWTWPPGSPLKKATEGLELHVRSASTEATCHRLRIGVEVGGPHDEADLVLLMCGGKVWLMLTYFSFFQIFFCFCILNTSSLHDFFHLMFLYIFLCI